jgi:outer membrane lipoprotein-sorting protein
MEKDRIEEVLKKLGSEDVPADVRQIAEEKAGRFRGQLYEQKSHFQLRNIIMKRKVLGFSVAAAVIVIAFCIGISFIGGTSGVALADVLQKVEQAQAFMYKLKMIMTGNMQLGMPAGETQMEGAITISTEYGVKMDMDMNTNIGGNVQKMRQLMYIVPEEKKVYMITPEQKQYIQMEFSDDLLARIKKQSNDPREILKQILNSKYTDIGKSEINGVEVEGFQTTDPAYAGNQMEDLKVVLWVDVKTWLPVRMEMNMKMNEQTKMEGVMEDFQWNIQVNADEFKPVIPQDYTTPLPGGYKLPSISEESAIDGLRFFADSTGKYPVKLVMVAMIQGIEVIAQQREDINSLSKEAQSQRLMEMMRPVQSLMGFYAMLVQDKKEPAYYGNVVGPSDADKVLLRWKTGDNEYRVIYGNLTAETVSAEKLADLESKIPK